MSRKHKSKQHTQQVEQIAEAELTVTASKKTLALLVGLPLVLLFGGGILLLAQGTGDTGANNGISDSNTSEESTAGTNTTSAPPAAEGETQYIEVTAKNGYSPRSIQAKAGVNTVIRFKTQNTYGCEAAMRIPALGVSKFLPATGTTDINVGTQAAGKELLITCSMGMYSSRIKFS